MGSPRRYGKAVLAIPVDSRNSWALNADAFSALALSLAGLIPAPERIFRSIDQVCYRRLRQGVHKSTPGPPGRPYQFGHFHPSERRRTDLKFRIRFCSNSRWGLPLTTI